MLRIVGSSSRFLAWLLVAAVLVGCGGGHGEGGSASGSAASASGSAGGSAESQGTVGLCVSGDVNDAADPCVITTVEQLQSIDEEPAGHYALGSAIDASSTAGWNDGAGFQPIRAFSGSFDGRGNIISDLHIDRPDDPDVGLFASTEEGSEVRNVRLAAARVIGESTAGMLVGEARGVISGSHVEGRVDGGGWVGGLVGSLRSQGSVLGSSARGEVVGTKAIVGGLVGLQFGEISSSFSLAAVSGKSDIGGLVGRSRGVVKRSYSLPEPREGEVALSGAGRVGALIGDMAEDGVVQESYGVSFMGSTPLTDFVGHRLIAAWSATEERVSDSYYGGNQRQDSPMGERRPVAEMKLAATFEAWDFDSVWSIVEGDDYPDLVSNPR